MFSKLRPKLNYSNAIATIALFVALGGAAMAAGLPRHSVGTRQLKQGAVTSAIIRKEAVNSSKLARKSVIAAKLAPNSVGPGAIGNGAVTSAKLADGSVIAASIKNGVITTNKLTNGAINTAKLANGAVTSAILANGSVTLSKLGDEVAPLLGTLRSGQTLRGMFNLGGTAAAANDKAQSGQSFQFPLTNTPTVNVIDPATATTIACPGLSGGNGQTPQAAAGQLCIYVTGKTNAATPAVPAGTLTRLGFGLESASRAAGDFAATGQWAVTAP
jgi:hypothetical protein